MNLEYVIINDNYSIVVPVLHAGIIHNDKINGKFMHHSRAACGYNYNRDNCSIL